MRPLTQINVIDVCNFDKGKSQCMFIAQQPHTYNFYCLKVTPLAATIRATTEAQTRRNAENKCDEDLPAGDNCPGHGVPPPLPTHTLKEEDFQCGAL